MNIAFARGNGLSLPWFADISLRHFGGLLSPRLDAWIIPPERVSKPTVNSSGGCRSESTPSTPCLFLGLATRPSGTGR